MNEKYTQIVIESLAEVIGKLQVDVIILRGERDRLKRENEELLTEKKARECMLAKECIRNA